MNANVSVNAETPESAAAAAPAAPTAAAPTAAAPAAAPAAAQAPAVYVPADQLQTYEDCPLEQGEECTHTMCPTKTALQQQLTLFRNLSRNYKNLYVVDLNNETARVLKYEDVYQYRDLSDFGNDPFPYVALLNEWIETQVYPDDQARIQKELSAEHLRQIFSEQNEYVGTYRMFINGVTINYQYNLSKTDTEGCILAGFQNIEGIIQEHLEQEKRTKELEQKYQDQLKEQLLVFDTLARNFKNVYFADLEKETARTLKLDADYVEVPGREDYREYPFAVVLNQWINTVVCPEDREKIAETITVENVRETLKTQDEMVGNYRSLVNGELHHFQYNISKVNKAGTKIILGFQNVDDIVNEHLLAVEKEKKKEKALQDALLLANQATRAKSTFLSNMSHDIRTPMNAIIGYTSLAQTHLKDTQLVQDYLEKIQTSSMHLLSLINQILDMSRIESGTVKLEEGEVHLPAILQDLRTILQGQITSKQQHVQIDLLNVVHQNVITDKLRLSQILLNLASNAVKYTGAGGTIIIKVTEKPCSTNGYATYELSVKDNGKGMAPEFVEHVFDSFTRERTSTASGVQGTGLGMSITKNIVDMMGGTITVESELGCGTEFVVTVDFKIASEHTATQEEHRQHRNYQGKRVLLVEDNDLNREIATALLEELGMAVDQACDGTEAVSIMNAANENTYNLIFMDIQMPMMDGYTATREIRTLSNNRKANIPIVAMTANAFEEDKRKAFEAGMNAHISKPVNVEDIAKALDSIF